MASWGGLVYASAVTGTLLFVLAFLAIFFILGEADFQGRLIQGGYLGAILGFPILQAFGFIASIVLLLLLLVIAILLALNISIGHLIFQPKTEEEQAEQKLKDNVVIKQGNEIVRPSADVEIAFGKQGQVPKGTGSTLAKSNVGTGTANEDKEIVLKMTKLGKWVLPPRDILKQTLNLHWP